MHHVGENIIASSQRFRRCQRILVLLAALVCAPSVIYADNNKDAGKAIETGLQAYRAGELGKATQQLTYALQLINDKYGELIIKTLPPALPGWQANKAKHQMSPIMLGGGVTVSRTYKKEKAKVTLQLVKDSPLLQSLHMVMNNPTLLGMEGSKLQQVHGHNAIVKFNEARRQGELSMIVENRFLILIKSSHTELADMLLYAEKIEFEMLKNLVN